MTTISVDLSATPAAAELTPRQRVKAIVAGSLGNLVEWYDFYAYAFTALYSPRASFRRPIAPRNC